MAEPTSAEGASARRRVDDLRDRVLAAAQPIDLSDDEKIALTQEEADSFFETIRNS